MATIKRLSTRVVPNIPADFLPMLIEHGWRKVERLYGKRAAATYYRALGGRKELGFARRREAKLRLVSPAADGGRTA